VCVPPPLRPCETVTADAPVQRSSLRFGLVLWGLNRLGSSFSVLSSQFSVLGSVLFSALNGAADPSPFVAGPSHT